MPLIIGFFLVLVGIYYFTVVLHLFGVQVFSKKDISIGKAAIPFFYWLTRKTKI